MTLATVGLLVERDRKAAGLEGADGLNRVVDDRPWSVPDHVDIDGDDLVCRGPWSRQVRSGTGLLEGFIALGQGPDVPPERIRDYARRWGTLGLCADHRLPCSHNAPGFYAVQRLLLDGDIPPGSACSPRPHPSGGHAEPILSWRFYAHQMATVFGAACLLDGEPIPDHMRWVLGSVAAVASFFKGDEAADDAQAIFDGRVPASARGMLASHISVQVDGWLQDGAVRPCFAFDPERGPRTMISGFGLFGALAYQMALCLNGPNGRVHCRGCGEVFSAGHRGRVHCDACKKGGLPARMRQQAKRKRDRQAREATSQTADPREAVEAGGTVGDGDSDGNLDGNR